jgi:hypothetical protein
MRVSGVLVGCPGDRVDELKEIRGVEVRACDAGLLGAGE